MLSMMMCAWPATSLMGGFLAGAPVARRDPLARAKQRVMVALFASVRANDLLLESDRQAANARDADYPSEDCAPAPPRC
jgi:hypothetical protein